MIGRITPLMTTAQVLQNISSDQDQMATTEEQLSTGKTINQPSDNPYGASLAVQLNTDLSGLSDYNNNITDGTAWTQAAGTALNSVQSMVQRVQELVVQASNGTESPTDLASTADEVSQLTASIKQAANTQYNGQYIFSGNRDGTAPYSAATGDTYQGNTGAVNREIGPNTSLQVNANISSLLGSGSSANDGKLLDTLDQITSDLNGGTSADVTDLSNNQLTNLSNSLGTLRRAPGQRRRRPGPADAGVDHDPEPSDQRHRGAVQRRRRQHGRHRYDLFQRAGRLHSRLEGRCQYRPVFADGLPEQLNPLAG